MIVSALLDAAAGCRRDDIAPSPTSKGEASARASSGYGVPVRDCWGDEGGWQCQHMDESWSTCRTGECADDLGLPARRTRTRLES